MAASTFLAKRKKVTNVMLNISDGFCLLLLSLLICALPESSFVTMKAATLFFFFFSNRESTFHPGSVGVTGFLIG